MTNFRDRPSVASDPLADEDRPIAGRLGRSVTLRSDSPSDERPLVIEHRQPLIYMLCAAAELEHALMCEYLFAAFSLKRSVDEGLTEEQLAVIERWRSEILLVAKQEMLHLAINSNLITALGASPHLSRPNLPQPARHYPADLITDPLTARVADLANVAYEVLLQLLYRLLSRIDETDEQMATLANVGIGLMYEVIEPLAEILTTLPVRPEHEGKTAGPSFELFYQPDYLLPHRGPAWQLMSEHLAEGADLADLEGVTNPRLRSVAAALRRHARTLSTGSDAS
jgi:hypothetical protein